MINARESTRTINILNASLLLSVVANLGVIALAFGGLSFGLVSFLPNMLPILAVGSMLFLTGRGMQFTAVIALTVAFGVAVNDSVHYINRFLHTDNDGSLAARLIETSRRIGPVIIGATLIIIAGVSTTLTSGMPTIGLFGKIAALTLVAGIIGDLIVLPALMGGTRTPLVRPPPDHQTARDRSMKRALPLAFLATIALTLPALAADPILSRLAGSWTGHGTYKQSASAAEERIFCKITNTLMQNGTALQQSGRCAVIQQFRRHQRPDQGHRRRALQRHARQPGLGRPGHVSAAPAAADA